MFVSTQSKGEGESSYLTRGDALTRYEERDYYSVLCGSPIFAGSFLIEL